MKGGVTVIVYVDDDTATSAIDPVEVADALERQIGLSVANVKVSYRPNR